MDLCRAISDAPAVCCKHHFEGRGKFSSRQLVILCGNRDSDASTKDATQKSDRRTHSYASDMRLEDYVGAALK